LIWSAFPGVSGLKGKRDLKTLSLDITDREGPGWWKLARR
jgi:hypothetical protein